MFSHSGAMYFDLGFYLASSSLNIWFASRAAASRRSSSLAICHVCIHKLQACLKCKAQNAAITNLLQSVLYMYYISLLPVIYYTKWGSVNGYLRLRIGMERRQIVVQNV